MFRTRYNELAYPSRFRYSRTRIGPLAFTAAILVATGSRRAPHNSFASSIQRCSTALL